MADLHSGNDRPSAGNHTPSSRRRYILRVTAGYAVLAALWICFSDGLLATLVDAAAIKELSMAKGLFFVVVTTLLLAVALRGAPGEDASPPAAPRLEGMFAATPGARAWIYAFAVVVSLTMLLVRSGIAVSFGERPLLILFMFPIILSAMVGGLGPGLVATVVAALGAAHCLPPAQSFMIEQVHDLFQWGFLVANGVLVSILSEMLHRLRRQTEVSRRLQAVTLASIGDGVITTDTQGRITFLNPEAERLTGWTNEEALGQPMATVFRVVGESNREPREDLAQKVLRGGEAAQLAGHGLLLTRDGRQLPVQDSGAPILLADGAMLGVVLVFRDIEARLMAEYALRESEATYRSLFENMLNGFAYCRMIFDNTAPLDFVYLSVNHAFETLTGLKDVVGRRVSEVIPGIREADPELFAVYGRVALGGAPERFETFVAALGMWFSIAVYSPKPEHFVAVFDVITERKNSELALRESEKRFRDIAEISADWIWEVDSAGCFTFASENVLNLLGFRAEEIIGKTPFDLMPQEEAARVTGEFSPEEVEKLITPETRLVAVTHGSNVTGAVNDIAAVAAACRQRGVPLLVDAAQTAGCIPIDLERTPVDYLAFSGHKGLLGPQGTGGLYVGNEKRLPPLLRGGTGSLSDREEQPDFMPDRYESGTLNVPGIAGLAAGVSWLLSRGVAGVREHDRRLRTVLLDILSGGRRITVFGSSAAGEYTGVVSVNVEGVSPSAAGEELETRCGILTRIGLHCAPGAHRSLGTFPEGTVRLSWGPFTSERDIVRAGRALLSLSAGA